MLAQAKLGESSQAWSKKNLTGLVNKHFVSIGQWGQVVQPVIYEAKDVNLEVTWGRVFLCSMPLLRTQKGRKFLNHHSFPGAQTVCFTKMRSY